MPNFKKLLAVFLIRSVVLTTCFSFAVTAKAQSPELYNQPFLQSLNLQQISNPSPVTIALVDEGVDFAHPELLNLQWINEKEIVDGFDNDSNGYTDDTSGWNFVLNSNNISPLGGHATKLAGVMQSIAQTTKANVKIMSLPTCEPKTGCAIKNVTKAIYYAVDNKADIINLSLGTPSYSPELMNAITYAFQKGVVLVTAAGNGNQNAVALNLDQTALYPICMDNGQNMVLGISSVSLRGSKLAWANYGTCVDIFAVGENIYTTLSPAFENQIYGYTEGTSYSAAAISALAATLKSSNPSLTNKEIMGALIFSQKNNLVNFSLAINFLKNNSSVKPTETYTTKKKKIYTTKKQPLKVLENKPKRKIR